MKYPVHEIEGIGAVLAEKLAVAGILTTEDLLEHCGAAKGRKKVAADTGGPRPSCWPGPTWPT